MKTIILTDTSIWGGLETHAASLAQTLAGAGHQVTILCLDSRVCEPFRQAVGSSAVVTHLSRPSRSTPLGWLLALRSIQAESILLEKGTLHTGGIALDCALRLKFRRYVAYQQLEPPRLPPRTSQRYLGGLVPGLGLWWYRWRWTGYARSLGPQMTICVSDATLHALADSYGFSKRKLTTIPHGVDLDRFRPDRAARDKSRDTWGVPADAFVFGSVRRFVHDKGLDVLIRAFAKLRTTTARDLRLVLVGEGPEHEALVSLAQQLGVGDAVVFPGFTPSPWTTYPGFDVFVIPSRIEALGVVVLEAMASGCFVIASRVGGIPEMVSDPSLGILVPADDVPALSDAMATALRMDGEELAGHLRHARQHVVDHFHLHTQSMKIARLLES